MPVSLHEFWDLIARSGLFAGVELETLRRRSSDSGSYTPRDSARAAAAWLVGRRKLTAYQAKILLQGKAGPFDVGPYRILSRRLSTAPATRCFAGVHLGTNHRILLHLWTENAGPGWECARQFLEWSRCIRHPNLDRVYETLTVRQQRWAVSEWPQGDTLRQLRQKKRRLSSAQACLIVQQIAQGAAHLHALGVTHGSLTADVVLVQPGGHVKLLRPPFSNGEAIRPQALPTDQALRYAPYLAPEFVRPDAAPDPLTDIYALGCLLYELLTGQSAFGGSSLDEMFAAHARQRIRPLEQFGPAPSGLTDVVSFMMAKRRELRYQQMTEVIDKLNAFVPTGIRQTIPRTRPTESYYLAQLDSIHPVRPQHLIQPLLTEITPHETVRSDPSATENDDSATGFRTTSETEPSIAVSGIVSASQVRRAEHPRGRAFPWLIGLAAVTAFAGLLSLMSFWRHQANDRPPPSERRSQSPGTLPSQRTETPIPPPRDGTTANGANHDFSSGGAASSVTLIDDDGRTRWASPTGGAPIDLTRTPSGAQLFIHVRPADLMKTINGELVLEALGPDFTHHRSVFERWLGISLSQVDRLLIAFVPAATGKRTLTCVIELSETAALDVLNRLEHIEPFGQGQMAQLDDWPVFLPATSGRELIIGDPQVMQEIANSSSAPPLRREIEVLRRVSDQDRHLTVLLAPNFLAADGRSLLSGSWDDLRQRLLRFIGPGIRAAAFSMHVTDNSYVELRWVCPPDESPSRVVRQRKEGLQHLAEKVSDYLANRMVDTYWQPLARRFPLMLQFVSDQTRVGTTGSIAELNAMLPPQAAHNVLLAAELATAISGPPEAGRSGNLDAGASLAIVELLEQPISLIVEQQSLERAVAELAELVREQAGRADFDIEIQGRDLQLEGITRNQQIRDLHLDNLPLRRVLTELVKRGNPTSVPVPTQLEQKLVWVVSGERLPRILVTTRTAAGQNGYTLPREFVAEEAP